MFEIEKKCCPCTDAAPPAVAAQDAEGVGPPPAMDASTDPTAEEAAPG